MVTYCNSPQTLTQPPFGKFECSQNKGEGPWCGPTLGQLRPGRERQPLHLLFQMGASGPVALGGSKGKARKMAMATGQACVPGSTSPHQSPVAHRETPKVVLSTVGARLGGVASLGSLSSPSASWVHLWYFCIPGSVCCHFGLMTLCLPQWAGHRQNIYFSCEDTYLRAPTSFGPGLFSSHSPEGTIGHSKRCPIGRR